jgi:predicted Fe-S protein YdhL (DUF1289 family)
MIFAENRFPLFGIMLYVPRRIATRHTMAIASPCTKVCTIDPRSQLCRGCGRTLGEIAQWMSLGEPERERIMTELPGRLAAHGFAPIMRPDERRRAGT